MTDEEKVKMIEKACEWLKGKFYKTDDAEILNSLWNDLNKL